MTKETAIVDQNGGNGELDKPLTPQEMKFVQLYVEGGGNGVQAYKQAGYSGKASDGGASGASRLLKRAKVSRAIAAALVEAGYSPDGVRSKLMVLAANDPRDFEPWFLGKKTLEELSAAGVDTSVIQEMMLQIKPTKDGDQITRKLRFHDAQLATPTLGRRLGLLDEKRHLTVSGLVGVGALDLRDKSPEELASIQAALASGVPPPGFEQQVPADPKEQLATTLIDEQKTAGA